MGVYAATFSPVSIQPSLSPGFGQQNALGSNPPGSVLNTGSPEFIGQPNQSLDTGAVLGLILSVMQLITEVIASIAGNGSGQSQGQAPFTQPQSSGLSASLGGSQAGPVGEGVSNEAPASEISNVRTVNPAISGALSRDQLLPLLRTENNSQEASQMLDTLWAIYNEPGGEGRRLIEGALKNGTTIEVGDPGPGANGLSITTQEGNNYQTRIIVNRADNIKTTVHELGHALTPEDDNSIQEEIANNRLGYEILNRITGESVPTPQSIAQTTRPLYAGEGLSENNGFVTNLFRLYGVTA